MQGENQETNNSIDNQEDVNDNSEDKDLTPFDLGGVNFTDPEGVNHNLPIVGYHVIDPKKGYLLVIGNDDTDKYVSSKDFTILKFENDEIMAIPTEEEYQEIANIFQQELARQAANSAS